MLTVSIAHLLVVICSTHGFVSFLMLYFSNPFFLSVSEFRQDALQSDQVINRRGKKKISPVEKTNQR